MESKSTHHYGIWIATTIAIVFAAIYVGALVTLSRSQKAVAAQASELAAEVQREESTQILASLLKDLSEDTSKLDAFFISPEGAVSVIEDIEGLSSVVGASISVADVHIEDENAETGEGTLTMNVSAEGSWRSMRHLLTLLDTLPFQSELTSVTLTLVSDEDSEAAAQWSLRGLVRVSLRR